MDEQLARLIESIKDIERHVYQGNAFHIAKAVKEDAKYLREIAEEIATNTMTVWKQK